MAGSKSIQIILARQLASCVAAPILLVDTEGTLVYYNESAEEIFNSLYRGDYYEPVDSSEIWAFPPADPPAHPPPRYPAYFFRKAVTVAQWGS